MDKKENEEKEIEIDIKYKMRTRTKEERIQDNRISKQQFRNFIKKRRKK